MSEQSEPIDNEPRHGAAPCNTCAFTYVQRTHVRDVYRMGSKRPGCAWYIDGVPMDVLKRKRVCPRYVEKAGPDPLVSL